MPRLALSASVLLLTTIVLTSPAATADEKPGVPPQPKLTSADFKKQGEYVAEVKDDNGNTHKVGVQIIARGEGDFDLVAYPGGLPGDGWYGQETVKTTGTTIDGVTEFKAEQGSGILEDGVLKAYAPSGDKVATFKKVERKSPTLGMKPPEGAAVLFDGTSGDAFKGARVTPDGYLREGITSKATFGDCTLHLEFCLSFEPKDKGQQRSNSGCYVQGRYEVQILDSFGLEGKNNECGGIYTVSDPAVNMCLPPMSWQTYDIDFTAAKFDENGKKTVDAKMTVKHNGVVVQKDVSVPSPTRAAPNRKEDGTPGPVYLQNHGDTVWFRNIWVQPKG